MPSPTPEALALGERYRLGLAHEPRRGSAGERLGRGVGSSLEFQDRRGYQPGDDVRHFDWRAFARTDQLFVRQYREEVLPRLELLVDLSRSMAADARKAARAVELAAVLVGAARGSSFEVGLIGIGDRPERLDRGRFLLAGLEFEARAPLHAVLSEAGALLRPGSLRLLLSDFLSPHEAPALVRALAQRSGAFALVQLLSRFDAEPEAGEALRLVDAEDGSTVDLVLDAGACTRYSERLERLSRALEGEAARAGGPFVSLRADDSLAAGCAGALVQGGVLDPA